MTCRYGRCQYHGIAHRRPRPIFSTQSAQSGRWKTFWWTSVLPHIVAGWCAAMTGCYGSTAAGVCAKLPHHNLASHHSPPSVTRRSTGEPIVRLTWLRREVPRCLCAPPLQPRPAGAADAAGNDRGPALLCVRAPVLLRHCGVSGGLDRAVRATMTPQVSRNCTLPTEHPS